MDKILTISRQYGSGGREIGQKLAAAWGIPFYDNELITRAAKESEAREEARRSSIRNLRMLDKAIMCDCPACRKRRSML